MSQKDKGKLSNKRSNNSSKNNKELVKRVGNLLKKGEKNNKVSSFTSRAAHACIQFWEISQFACQNCTDIESIYKH
jgi:hypothetical protein